MIKFFYNILTLVGSFGFFLFSWVKPKWKLRAQGLRNQKLSVSTTSKLWFHCSSAGEFEQIAEVIEQLSKSLPQYPIFISFFSPSGIEWMEAKKLDYQYAYLPFDNRSKMRAFIQAINPKCLIISKNEFWPNMLDILGKRGIPTFMVSAKVTENYQALKNPFFRQSLSYLNGIYTQDEKSKNILFNYNKNTIQTGDTRISRILSRSKFLAEIPYYFTRLRPTIVYGSMHNEDLKIINNIKSLTAYNHIIVPHDVSISTIDRFKEILGPNPPLSSQTKKTDNHLILVDEMGKLSSIYKHSNYAYIGGGFSSGIHNIIEPLVLDNQVIIGPNYTKFQEANFLVKKKSIEVITQAEGFRKSLEKIVSLPEETKQKRLEHVKEYIDYNKDSVERVVKDILKKLEENGN